jgi:hypothetical protein
LAVSRMLAASARCSSLGTTTSTAIQGLASLLREWSTMDEHKLFSELGKRCCLLLTKSILRGLSESSRRHSHCPKRYGSTRQRRQQPTENYTKFSQQVSQSH